jgi:hypothetical protein
MKHPFLVVYDYGQGGAWAYVLAPSKECVLKLFPELTIVDETPAWMTKEFQEKLNRQMEDVDDPVFGLLADVIAQRAK